MLNIIMDSSAGYWSIFWGFCKVLKTVVKPLHLRPQPVTVADKQILIRGQKPKTGWQPPSFWSVLE